jgi:hypothetical protein
MGVVYGEEQGERCERLHRENVASHTLGVVQEAVGSTASRLGLPATINYLSGARDHRS